MADNLELLLEAERRGLLPDDKRQALAEARRRGLVPMAPVPMDAGQKPEPSQGLQDYDEGQALSNLAKGVYRGAEATVQAGAQLAVRTPGAAAASRVAQATGQPDPVGSVRQSVDDQATASAQAFDASPAGQSVGGQLGQFAGAVAMTTPLAALSVPAKGAKVLNALRTSAVGGAAAGAASPVVEGEFWDEKRRQMAIGAGVGVGVTGALRGGMAVAERVGYTPNALAQVANVANKRANRTAAEGEAPTFADQGEALAGRTGVRLTPGQVSGSRVQTSLENMSRQSVFSSDLALAADQKVADDAIAFINRTMDDITPNGAGAAQVGDRIQQAAKTSVAKITQRRDQVAAQQFGPIEQALAGRKFVDYGNTRKALDDLIAEYRSVATPEADRIVEQATRMRERLSGQHTLGDFQRQRGYFGKAVGGEGSVFDEVDRSINQRVARRLYGAMSDDLDASAARLDGSVGAGIVPAEYFAGQMQPNGGLAAALREANANYRRFSQLAEGVRAHPIARLFGKDIKVDGEEWFNTLPPEQVVQRLGLMAPTEIRMVRQYMEGADPQAWQQYKRLLVQNALDAAQIRPISSGTRQIAFNAGSFLRTLGGDKPAKLAQLREMFSPEEMGQIDDAFAVAYRLGDRFGSNPSGTGPYNEVQSFLQSLKQRSVEAAASTAGEAMGLRKVANVMLNADGRRALIRLSQLPPQSRQAASLMAYLAALASGEQTVNPDQAGDGQRQ